MNFPFIIVLVAVATGLASEQFLRNMAPEAGPALALVLIAAALVIGARLLAPRPLIKSSTSAEPAAARSAGHSLNPA